MKKIIVIGAGQLGSRHIQALKKYCEPLEIYVFDPSEESLKLSQTRFDQIENSKVTHNLYLNKDLEFNSIKRADLAIIATSAQVRFQMFQKLLEQVEIPHVVLEKVLFTNPQVYSKALDIIREKGVSTWVNCCMRQIGIYKFIKQSLGNSNFVSYYVSSSKFGLLTNSIHYVDHMVHVIGSFDFTVDPSGIHKDPIESKRIGFKEYTGRLDVRFANGSIGRFVNFTSGSSPIVVEISSGDERFIVRETEGVAFHCGISTNWEWRQIEAQITPQSILTTELTQQIFESGSCLLTPLEDSVKIHLPLYEPIREHLNLTEYNWT